MKVVSVDRGGTLNGILLRDGLVDEISILVCPSRVGGMSPKSIFRTPDLISSDGMISTQAYKHGKAGLGCCMA